MATLKTLKVRSTFFRPLIMSNPQTVQISNSFAIIGRKLNSELKAARKKGDEARMCELEKKQIRNDWEASSYWSETDNGFYLPDTIILAAIRAGGASGKKGKDIDRAVTLTEMRIPIVLPASVKHKTAEQFFGDVQNFHMQCPCKVPPKTGALIWKCRCMMPTGSSVVFSCEFDNDVLAIQSLKDILVAAGTIGMGGWRPKFGRFTVEFI